MLFLNGGHLTELKEALGAGLPALFAAVGLSLVLVVLTTIPPSALPPSVVSDFLVHRRRQVGLVGAAIVLSTAAAVLMLFWVL